MDDMEWEETNDKENYDEMSTQELAEMVKEGGLSQTTMKEVLDIAFAKIQQKNDQIRLLQTENEPSTSSKQNKLDSILKAVLQGMMEKSGFRGTMEEFWGSEECKDLTKKWASHVKKSKSDTEKFTPLDVIYNNDKVAMQIVDGLLQVVKMKKVGNEWKFNGWAGRLQKCSMTTCIAICRIKDLCSTHAPREVLLLQDMRATTPVLALLNPHPTMTPYTQSEMREKLNGCGVKKIHKGKELLGGTEIKHSNIQLYEYVVEKRESRKEETFFKIIERWPYQDDNNRVRDSVYLALSLLVMIRGGATLLNTQILFRNADLAWVKSFLNQNGVEFKKGEEIQQEADSSSPPGVSGTINRSLPYVYLGRNDAALFYVGVQNQISLRFSGARSAYHDERKGATGMDSFTDDENMVIFQSPIPPVLQHIQTHTSRNKFSPEQEEEFKKMEQAANKYETLAHSVLKIGEMLDKTYKETKVKGVPKQMNHFEGAISIVDLKPLYTFFFESNLVMSEVSQLEKGDDGKVVITCVV